MRQDHLIRTLTQNGRLRLAAADTTALVAEICRRQGADLTASVALGRLVTGAALMGCLLKGSQRLALMIEGNGPLGRLMVETDADGNLRAKVQNPLTGLPPRDGRFDVAGAIGRAGFLHVIKDLGLKEPYRSMVQLQTSEIGEDLAWYLTHSEQVPSCVALGVELDARGEVAAAGGFLVQAMPGAEEGELLGLEKVLAALPPTTSLLRQGVGPAELLERIVPGQPLADLKTIALNFNCPCTREQISALLAGLGRTELEAMIAEQNGAEVGCDYCRERYLFSADQLRSLRA